MNEAKRGRKIPKLNMPDWKTEIKAQLAGLQFDAAREAGIVEEISQHLDDRFTELRARGMTQKDARQAVLEEWAAGNLLETELRKLERAPRPQAPASGERKGNILEELFVDLKYGARMLRKDPGFTTITLLTLALGIGANTAMFSIVNGVLLKPLPYEQPGQLVQIWEASPDTKRNPVSPGAFVDWKDHNTIFENLALWQEWDINLTGAGQPERLHGMAGSAASLRILRARPLIGRIFAAEEDQPGKDKVVMLGEGIWRRRFGGLTNILGGTVQLNGENYTVIGVYPRHSLMSENAEFVIPTAIAPADASKRDFHWLRVIGRLKPGITVAQAQAEMTALAARLRPLYPAYAKDWSVNVIPMREQITGDVKPTLLILAGAVGCVLLIVCANVANLFLAKAAGRRMEITLRGALGASRGRIIRQLLAESTLVSLFGALLGILLAFLIVTAFAHQTAINLPRAQEVSLDLRVLTFALAISILAGIGFGLAPALQMSRPDLNQLLKEGARGCGGGSRNKVRGGLIVSEVALSIVLLMGAGLLLNSFVRLLNVPPGFNPRHALSMQISLPEKKYPDSGRRAAFLAAAVEKISNLPGVQAVGAVEVPPLAEGSESTSFSVVGRENQPALGYLTTMNFCTPDYFRAVETPLLKGRFFDQRDRQAGLRVAVISEALARKQFPKEDPIGKTIHLDVYTGRIDQGWEIVGVVGDIREQGLETVNPCVYRPQAISPGTDWHFVIRTAGPPLTVGEGARAAIQALDPDQPVSNVRTLEEAMAAAMGRRKFTLLLLGGFAAAALLLAAIGLYGVIACTVSQRTRELGIRAALGATRRNVLGLVLRQGLALGGLGVLVGLAAACGLTRLMAGLLYEIKPADPLTFVSVSVAVLLVVLLASWLPARRASRVDPMIALRYE
jgi:putative ABC transport system permease protein